MSDPTPDQLTREIQCLRDRLEAAEEALRAIRAGEADAVLVERERAEVLTLETPETPYRLLVEQMPHGASTLTEVGRILYCNRRFAELVGAPHLEVPGQQIEGFVAPESRPILGDMLRRGFDSEVHGEIVLRRADGTTTTAYLGVVPLQEGALGRCLMLNDLTARRHYQELRHGEQALRDADRRKDEFLAILAHELRNPLAPVRNAVHYLMLKGPTDPDLRRSVEMIERQVSQMARLIDDLLDVSRISRGTMELRLERVVLADIVGAAVESCRHLVQTRGHRLQVSLPPEPVELHADRARLVQVLWNLLSNAARYTSDGGAIDLSATTDGTTLELRVRDDGIGIPPEKLAEIFVMFAQVHPTSEQEGGLGIGLTLARQIVELHRGTIEARSEGVGRGSEFLLRFPVAEAKAAPEAAGDPTTAPAAMPRRILVVDDNRDAVESLALLLRFAGHDVRQAYDGETALAAVKESSPDVAMLDIGMPRMNGYEVARRIRQEASGARVYLVALTGWGDEDDRRRARQAGFDAHLVKPVAPEALDRLLATIDAGASASKDRIATG